MAQPFKSFDDAVRHLPKFIRGLDIIGQHRTVSDLAFLVQHEIDLAVTGEANTIKCRRQSDTTKRWQVCRAFLIRCKAADAESLLIERSEQQIEFQRLHS